MSDTPRFVTGSTLRHVLVMTATSSVGLMAVFFVDVLNLLYISMLGHQELAAAIGYSGTLMFFLTSVAIGLTIAIIVIAFRAVVVALVIVIVIVFEDNLDAGRDRQSDLGD